MMPKWGKNQVKLNYIDTDNYSFIETYYEYKVHIKS